ncbi:hypothetical protein Kisp01_00130 [Kineosporia sp. NBRC 101677]|nr:hypothetical protein Kisp01_00130 [Kineosporia sp. NBRC 101677]
MAVLAVAGGCSGRGWWPCWLWLVAVLTVLTVLAVAGGCGRAGWGSAGASHGGAAPRLTRGAPGFRPFRDVYAWSTWYQVNHAYTFNSSPDPSAGAGATPAITG